MNALFPTTTSLLFAAFEVAAGCAHTNRVDSPSAAGVSVHAEREASGYAVVVSNLGNSDVSLASAVIVERSTGDTWTAIETSGLALRTSCVASGGVIEPAPRCVRVKAGGALRASAWLGTTGDAQCMCERCTPVAVGRYRFVLQPCEGGAAIRGEPFTVVGR